MCSKNSVRNWGGQKRRGTAHAHTEGHSHIPCPVHREGLVGSEEGEAQRQLGAVERLKKKKKSGQGLPCILSLILIQERGLPSYTTNPGDSLALLRYSMARTCAH